MLSLQSCGRHSAKASKFSQLLFAFALLLALSVGAFAQTSRGSVSGAIVDPILGNVTALHAYEQGTWGPAEAEKMAADAGGWHNPAGSS